jgi:flavin-binding protein dodecin
VPCSPATRWTNAAKVVAVGPSREGPGGGGKRGRWTGGWVRHGEIGGQLWWFLSCGRRGWAGGRAGGARPMGADSRAREVGVGKRALQGARASRSGRTAHVARCRVAEASGAVASGQVGYFFFRRVAAAEWTTVYSVCGKKIWYDQAAHQRSCDPASMPPAWGVERRVHRAEKEITCLLWLRLIEWKMQLEASGSAHLRLSQQPPTNWHRDGHRLPPSGATDPDEIWTHQRRGGGRNWATPGTRGR